MQQSGSVDEDLRAIESLNQRDVQAALASDLDLMMSQWSDDFTILPPGGPIVRGRNANIAIAREGMAQVSAFEPVEHVVEFEEIVVAGNYAFEWGTYRGTSRPRAGGNSVSYGGKIMRILQRQPDGSWKMYRTMTTVDGSAH